MKSRAWLLLLAGCGAAPEPAHSVVQPPVLATSTGEPADAPVMSELPIDAATPNAPTLGAEVWLKGSTHVHARPSGDSSEPIAKVIEWYQTRGYDFIALTDHNRVSELDAQHDTHGNVAVSAPEHGLIVLAGIELTHNPSGCLPPGDKSKKCRIHVNVLGPTARPAGKVDWANRKTHERLDKYDAALVEAKQLDGKLIQINHPQWFWGMTGGILTELSRRGVRLVEIENVQFDKWNSGDAGHPSMEALWDDALGAGATLWGIADDDAHAYEGHGQWPAGGGWIVVKARRDPQAILDSLAAGRFYASTGVVLDKAEIDGDALVVEVASSETGTYTIAFIENGKLVETVAGKAARRALPASGYVRAVVTRNDGKKAWLQPARH